MQLFRSVYDRLLTLGVAQEDTQVAGQIRAAQIEAVRRYTPWMMGANIANALILVVAFFNSPAFAGIAIWAGAVVSLALFALLMWWQRRELPKPRTASMRGIRRTVIHAAILGGIWAVLPAVFFASAAPEQRLVLSCVVAGMLCGSGFALATIAPAALAFAGMLTLGAVLALLTDPSFTTVVLLMLNTIYVGVILSSTLALAQTLRARFEAQIRSEEQRELIGVLLNDFEEHGSDWLWMTDRHWRMRHASSRLTEILGLDDAQLIAQRVIHLLPLRSADASTADDRRMWRTLLRSVRQRKAFRDLEVPVRIGSQDRLWSLTAKPAFAPDGRFDGYRGVGRDVTLASEARRKIEYMARFDSLTGLPNRVTLNDELGGAVARLKRHRAPFALLLLDLDHFKFINDTQGHPVGDALLKQAAARLMNLAREMDTVARLGGDEFAIVLTGIRSAAQAGLFAQRVVSVMAEPFELAGGDYTIGASVGIAYAEDDTDADTLIRHADLALYRAKGEGRGRCFFFEPELDAAARRRHQIESDLRQALERGGLQLHYQPLVNSVDGAIVCCEALMRWDHPELGLLSPAEFIPLAEETGLIGALGSWALGEACREAMTWPGTIRVAVNLSPVQFRSPSLFVDVRRALATSGLPPGRLELEITESLFLDTSGLVYSTLDALRALGVRIALDDFGTGYSSLSYLKKYSFEKLKIDRSFIDGIEREPTNLAIVAAVVRLSHDLGIAVSVEGVETEGQLEVVRRLGCDEVQGYLVSRPITASGLRSLIEAGSAGMLLRA